MIFDENFREIFSPLMVCLIIDFVCGTLLVVYTKQILLIPGMLILLPGFLEMRNNIEGSVAARISTGLFVGKIKPMKAGKQILKANFVASFSLALIVSFILSLVAFFLTYFIFHQLVYKLILIAFVAGIITNLIQIPLTIFMTIYLYKKGFDPDNIMGAVITSIGDIIGILALLGVILLL
jgi:mgtE-like transporter